MSTRSDPLTSSKKIGQERRALALPRVVTIDAREYLRLIDAVGDVPSEDGEPTLAQILRERGHGSVTMHADAYCRLVAAADAAAQRIDLDILPALKGREDVNPGMNAWVSAARPR